MFARLTLPRFPIDVIETVMIEGRSLCEEALPHWAEVFLFLVGHRAAHWTEAGKPDFGTWLAGGLRSSQWSKPESREAVIRHIADAEVLRRKADEALTAALVESSRLGFWVNLGISGGVKDGRLWFEVRHADKIGSQRLTLGDPGDEPGESMALSLEVREDVEAGVQMFGPMLAALCFGRATIGVQMPTRPARALVKLKLFDGEEEELTAGRALVKLAELAETATPNILVF